MFKYSNSNPLFYWEVFGCKKTIPLSLRGLRHAQLGGGEKTREELQGVIASPFGGACGMAGGRDEKNHWA